MAALGYQLIAIEAWQVDQGFGPSRRQAVAVDAVLDEKAGAEAESKGQAARRQLQGIAGVGRGGCGIGIEIAGGPAFRHAFGGVGPRAQQGDDRIALVGVKIEGGEIQVLLRRRQDARLVQPEERLAARELGRAHGRCLRLGHGLCLGWRNSATGSNAGGGQTRLGQEPPPSWLAGVVGLVAHLACMMVLTSSST